MYVARGHHVCGGLSGVCITPNLAGEQIRIGGYLS